MNIIFLDFGGVLDSKQWSQTAARTGVTTYPSFCPISCSNVQDLLDRDTRTYIVVTSAWGLGRDLSEVQDLLARNGIARSRVIGKLDSGGSKGLRIKQWLDAHPECLVVHYVIIDDTSFILEDQKSNLVQVDENLGFMWDKKEQAAHILGLN